MRRFSVNAACAQIGVKHTRVHRLLAAGFLQAGPDGTGVMLAGNETMQTLRRDFLGSLVPPASPEEEARFVAGLQIFGVRPTELPSEVVLSFAREVRKAGDLVGIATMRPYLGRDDLGIAAVLRRLEAEGHDLERATQPQYRSVGEDNDIDALEALLGSRYAAPPGTPLDPKLGNRGDATSPMATEKVVRLMRPGRLRTVTAILLLLDAARTAKDYTSEWLVNGAVGLDPIVAGTGDDTDALRATLEEHGFGFADDHALARQRIFRVYMYSVIAGKFSRWLEGLKPAERRRFASLELPLPRGSQRFFQRVTDRLAKIDKASASRTDRRVQHLVDRPHHASIVASERVAEVLGLRDRARLEIVSSVDRGDGPDQFPIRFEHPYVAIRVIDGQVYRFPQRLVLTLDRWDLLDRRLARDLPRHLYQTQRYNPYDPSRQPETNGFENEYVVSYVDCVPEVAGGAVSPPVFVDYHRVHLFDTATLSGPQRADWRRVHSRYGFVASINSVPAGLMAFEGKTKRNIARHAAELYGHVPLPVEETLHGFAYGALFFQTCLDDGGRAGEGEQLAEDPALWDWVTQDGRSFRAYKGLAKGRSVGEEELFGIGEESEAALGLAIRTSVERWFLTPGQRGRHGITDPEQMLPSAPANRDLRKRGVAPSRWVMNVRGVPIPPGAAAKLLALLMGGYLVIEGHDMRRAFGGGVRKLGASREERQRLLNQLDPGSLDRYGGATPTEGLSRQIQWLSHLARATKPEARSMAHVEERRRDVIAATGALPPVLGGGCLRGVKPCDVRLACFRCPDHAPEPDRRGEVVYALRCAEALETLALEAGRRDDATRHAADAERCRAKLTEIDEVARLRGEAAGAAVGDVRDTFEDSGEKDEL